MKSDYLGNHFAKRLMGGEMIDRTKTKRRKNVKTVKAPNALTKFFTTPKEAL